MRYIISLFTIVACMFISFAQAQGRKIDTTASFGDASYHISCNNKKELDNTVSVSPKGFKNTVRDFAIPIRGQLKGILVDDWNDDGFPDVLICISTTTNPVINMYAIASKLNEEVVPVFFPDIYSDPKVREGYRGYDEFSSSVGSLFRSFPIYKATDTDKPTGGTRVVQYKIMKGENGGLTFKILRSYEK